ncbi:MAG: histidine triad nucleotide-binding protein [Patescibacteria group bacterium]
MTDCIFCKIVAHEIPANIIFENEHIMAFHDINPKARVHILIISKKHICSVNEITEKDTQIITEVFLSAKQIAKEQNILDSGYRITVNTGPDSGQEVAHIHWHLMGGGKLKDLA